MRQKWYCMVAFLLSGEAVINISLQYGIPLVFSGVPLTFCLIFYWKIAKVLFARKRKIGRNLNLLLCFATICFVWTLSLMAKAGMGASEFHRAITHKSLTDLLDAPFYYNYGQADCVRLLFSMTSLVDPVILLICQRNYRILSKKRRKTLRDKIKAWKER